MPEQWVELDEDEPLQPGDVVRLYFRTVGGTWIRAAEAALIEWRLRNREEFEIINYNLIEADRLIFKIRVKKTNPIIVTGLVILGAFMIAAGAIPFVLERMEKFVKETAKPIIQVLAVGGTVTVAILILVLLIKRK